MIIGCIEAGGTKFNCGIGNETGVMMEQIQIPTTTPDETMDKVISFFKKYPIDAIGLGCFGPIDLNKLSPTYGYILQSPKLAWQNFDMVGTLTQQFPVKIGFDTDVNGACLGESLFGAAKGLKNVIYLTIGTGIGTGALVNGTLIHGMLHPEAGHILIKRDPTDSFEGNCPFHHDCFEGLASGPAIEARYHKKGQELSEWDEGWKLVAYYIAQALVNYILILSPEKIIVGGGVSKQPLILPYVRKYVKELINGYISLPDLDHFITLPGLLDQAGIIGALCLGIKSLKE